MQAWVAVLVLALSAGAAAVGGIELPSLRGGTDSIAAHAGQPVVAVVVDARRLATAGRWAKDLVARFPKLYVVAIADVNEAGTVTLERVTERLAGRVPDEAHVLIDLQRAWARGFELDTGAPNLLIFDAGGAAVAQFRGRWTAALAEEVAGRIAAMEGAT